MCGINILGQTIKTSNCCRTKTIFVANISSSDMTDHCLVQVVVLSAKWKYHIYDLLIPSPASSNLCFENLGACKFHCFTIHPNLVIFSFLLNYFTQMHIAGKGIWHHTKTFAMKQEILMELYWMSSSLLRKISAGALMHIVNIIIYGKLKTSVIIKIKCIDESISTFSTLIFTSTWTATWIMNYE